MYVYIYVKICIYICIYKHLYTYISTNTFIFPHCSGVNTHALLLSVHAYTSTHIHNLAHTNIFAQTHTLFAHTYIIEHPPTHTY